MLNYAVLVLNYAVLVLNYAVLDRSEAHSSRPRTYLPSRSGATHALRVQSSRLLIALIDAKRRNYACSGRQRPLVCISKSISIIFYRFGVV